MNFKLGRQLEHALSTAMASYKGLVKLGYFTRAGEYRVGCTRNGHTTCWFLYYFEKVYDLSELAMICV